jgi:alkylation response protein AidB-like acyl-CoA dehydrogenase
MMEQRYRFSAEQEQFRASLRQVLEELGDPRALYADPPESPERLQAALTDLGLPGLGVPDDAGGVGGSVLEQVVAAEEIGRAVAPVDLIATAAIAAALSGLGAPAADLLAQVSSGKRAATIAFGLPGSGQTVELRAREQGGRWLAAGTARLLLAATPASVVVAPVTTPSGTALAALTGADVQAHRQLDRTRPLNTVVCDDAAAVLLTDPADTAETERALRGGLRRARLLLAAESVGAGDAALQLTAAYTRQRKQFGQPIGTFQAVKHRLADALVAVENARSAVYAAAWSERDGTAEAELLTSVAKAVASEAGVHAAAVGVQLHGGIAITWEHVMHLYLRRAKSNEALLGEPQWHLERIAAHLLGDAAT